MNQPDDATDARELLRAKLNLETARLDWCELERHFARGVVMQVAAGVDLVGVALLFAQNRASEVERLIADAGIARAESDEAQRWHAAGQTFWAVVVAPWVLVQEIAAEA